MIPPLKASEMQLDQRIKDLAAAKYPIQYVAEPGKQKDCRVKIMQREMARVLCSQKIWAQVSKIIEENKASSPGTITHLVNDYLDTYLEKHPD